MALHSRWHSSVAGTTGDGDGDGGGGAGDAEGGGGSAGGGGATDGASGGYVGERGGSEHDTSAGAWRLRLLLLHVQRGRPLDDRLQARRAARVPREHRDLAVH